MKGLLLFDIAIEQTTRTMTLRVPGNYKLTTLLPRRRVKPGKSNKNLLQYSSFALVRPVTGLKNSRHFLDQSEVKPKPLVIRSRTFSRAFRQLQVFASSFDWFTGL